jgi:hypothetical protein
VHTPSSNACTSINRPPRSATSLAARSTPSALAGTSFGCRLAS